MKRTLQLFLIVFSLVLSGSNKSHAIELLRNVEGERDYVMYIPNGAQMNAPLLIVYHDTPFPIERLKLHSRLEDYAEMGKFILIMPVMEGERWQDGTYGAGRNIKNDIAYTDVLIAAAIADYAIDPRRIYTAGMGSGGFMAQSYACYGRYKLAGIAVVAAATDKDLATHCNIPPLDVLFAHGSNDKIFMRTGWMYKNSPYYTTEESVDFWIGLNKCTTKETTKIVSEDAKDKTSVVRMTFGGCSNAKAVRYFDINGGGHTWPGSYKKEKPDYGWVTQAINMSGLITNMVSQK